MPCFGRLDHLRGGMGSSQRRVTCSTPYLYPCKLLQFDSRTASPEVERAFRRCGPELKTYKADVDYINNRNSIHSL